MSSLTQEARQALDMLYEEHWRLVESMRIGEDHGTVFCELPGVFRLERNTETGRFESTTPKRGTPALDGKDHHGIGELIHAMILHRGQGSYLEELMRGQLPTYHGGDSVETKLFKAKRDQCAMELLRHFGRRAYKANVIPAQTYALARWYLGGIRDNATNVLWRAIEELHGNEHLVRALRESPLAKARLVMEPKYLVALLRKAAREKLSLERAIELHVDAALRSWATKMNARQILDRSEAWVIVRKGTEVPRLSSRIPLKFMRRHQMLPHTAAHVGRYMVTRPLKLRRAILAAWGRLNRCSMSLPPASKQETALKALSQWLDAGRPIEQVFAMPDKDLVVMMQVVRHEQARNPGVGLGNASPAVYRNGGRPVLVFDPDQVLQRDGPRVQVGRAAHHGHALSVSVEKPPFFPCISIKGGRASVEGNRLRPVPKRAQASWDSLAQQLLDDLVARKAPITRAPAAEDHCLTVTIEVPELTLSRMRHGG